MKSKLLRFTLLGVALMNTGIVSAFKLAPPKFNANITLQGQKFYGDYFNAFGGYVDGPVSKYALRHGTIGISGSIGEYVEYEFKAGSATCLVGGAFTLMDAEVLYKPVEFLKLGFKKGEIMRGFEFNEECVKVLTAEKPRFAKTFAPCHPMGAVLEMDYDFDETMGVLFQFAYLDGQSQNLDDEHDMNLGLQFRTPCPGLSIGGFYTDIKKDYGPGPGPDFEMVNDKGMRTGAGFDFDANNILFRSEIYALKGYYNNPSNNTLYENNSDTTTYIESKDLEMRAFFVEGGYTFATGLKQLPFVQPYARFQVWDKASNAAGDQLYSYITGGVTFYLDQEKHTLFRIDYEERLDTPNVAPKDASLLIIRLQTDL